LAKAMLGQRIAAAVQEVAVGYHSPIRGVPFHATRWYRPGGKDAGMRQVATRDGSPVLQITHIHRALWLLAKLVIKSMATGLFKELGARDSRNGAGSPTYTEKADNH